MQPLLEKHVSDLTHDNPNVRMIAVETIAHSGAPEAINLLLNSLQDIDPDVRRVAARALGTLANPTAIPSLINALRDKAVHSSAARALYIFGQPEYHSCFDEAIVDPDPAVRKVAVQILGRIHTNDALLQLTNAIHDKDWQVRKSALNAISQFKTPVVVELLVDALTDERSHIRRLAAERLKSYGQNSAIPLLIKSLNSEHEFVREAIITALGLLDDPSVILPIFERLNDPSENVRKNAARALEIRKEPIVIDLLVKALKQKDATVCKLASEILKTFDAETITGPLKEVFLDNDFHDRRYVIELLSTRGGSQAVEPLISVLDETDAEVRSLAASALKNIPPEILIQPLVDALNQNLLNDKNTAIEILGTLNHPDIIPPLIDALQDEAPYVRAKAARALDTYPAPISIEKVISFLDAESSSLRKLIYRLLGRSQDEAAVKPLTERLHTAPKSEHIEIIPGSGNFHIKEVASTLSRIAVAEALYPMHSYHALGPLLEELKKWDTEALTIPVNLMVSLYLEGKRDLAHTLGRALSFHRQKKNIRNPHKLFLTDEKGVSGLDALRELNAKKEWRHLGFFLSRDFTGLGYLNLKIVKVLSLTHQLQKKDAALLVCTQHLARYARFRKNAVNYLGCRICEQTHTVAKTQAIVAVLDLKMSPELVVSETSFRVNWLIQRRIYDYDVVEIGHCAEESITEFCIDLGNDPDPNRARPSNRIRCVIQPDISLSEHAMTILKRQFKRVVQQ